MKDMNDVTAAGVQAQSDIDQFLDKAYKAALRNIEVTEKGVEFGMVRALKGKKMIATARKLAGLIAAAAECAAELHIEQTAACVANGCDTGALTSVGGVTLLAVAQPLGGGR
jgi:hypothetical protein